MIKPKMTNSASILLVTFTYSLIVLVSGQSDLLSSYQPYFTCDRCDVTKCPELSYCEGKVIKDHCNCCDECSNRRFQPHLVPPTPVVGADACGQVKCPKFKVCMKNIQGLPLCSCPSPNVCGNKKRTKKEICGTDGVTYTSKCHLRIASCNSGVAVRKQYRGECTKEDSIKASEEHKRKLKKMLRKQRRQQRRREKEESTGRRKSRKNRRRRRKRRKSGSSQSHKKSREKRRLSPKGRSKRRHRRYHRILEFERAFPNAGSWFA